MPEKELRIKDGDIPKPLVPQQRLVTFELVPEGFKIIRNDCVSLLEFRGLLLAANEIVGKK